MGCVLCLIPEMLRSSPEKIPIEYCDVLPVIRVQVEDSSLLFLVDTAATSMLNICSFAKGRSTAIQVSSWKGPMVTSAREVHIPELRLGNHRFNDLRLPAIDLSPIAKSCGGRIDGILGVDLLEQLEATLELSPSASTLTIGREGPDEDSAALQFDRDHCTRAFNQGDLGGIRECFDPQFTLYTSGSEIRGREGMLDYLLDRYFSLNPAPQLSLRLEDQRSVGNAIWFGYDLTIRIPNDEIHMQGMAICRRSGDRWRLLSMHNSFEEKR